jgi:apolipoprotein D and lipocalin family protein
MKKQNKAWLITGVLASIGIIGALSACKSVKVPDGVEVVQKFEAKKYMGQWYEIARFDFKYEKDMSHVTANYTLNDDGSVKVVNKGYNYVKDKWEEKEGKAKFIDRTDQAALKVSFFGPFYSGYNVVAMDPDYENVLVFGESTDYIWILSRNKTIPEKVKQKFLDKAKAKGYDLDRLVWTKHD